MTILLDDISCKDDFYPFGQLKSVAHIHVGMFTLIDRWKYYFSENVLLRSENPDLTRADVEVPVNLIPSFQSLKELSSFGEWQNDGVRLNSAIDIFKNNDWILREDFKIMTDGKPGSSIPDGVQMKERENIFIEGGAMISFCTINATTGPVYISKDAEIMDGVLIRGPLFVGPHAVIKMGAKIYGATTLGPYCMAGGEVKNSVLMGYSNKAHDGYLGDSVLGEWCNLGAGTSNSNLKNNASEVSVQFSENKNPVNAGQKCGLLMGDYSRSSINTSFNTGSVVGVCSNILDKTPGKFTSNFKWGDKVYEPDKVFRDINNWKKLKGFKITEEEILSIKKLYHQS